MHFSTTPCPAYFSPCTGAEFLPGLHWSASPKLFKLLRLIVLGIDLLDLHPSSLFLTGFLHFKSHIPMVWEALGRTVGL